MLGLGLAAMFFLADLPGMDVMASSISGNGIDYNIKVDNPDRIINDDDRADADADLLYYMQSLEVRYRLDEKMMENLHKVFDSAVYYIANTEMTVSELATYVASTKGAWKRRLLPM